MVVAVFAGAYRYWLHARHFEGTDDAFIDGHVSQVSAQISGRVTSLAVEDNQAVSAGQVLLQIDPRDAQMRLVQLVAARDQAGAALAQARAMLPVRQADLDQASAQIRVYQADAMQSVRDLGRYAAINPRAISAQTLDQARATRSVSQAKLDAARQAEAGMRAQLAVAGTQIDAQAAGLRAAESNIEYARLQLSYTQVSAPAPGRVARRTVEIGNYVSPGQALLSIVQPQCWVTANLKENQLAHLQIGQHAAVSIDAFPDRTLDAHVDSVQSGTGAVFSSLPAENATGNYVKIVQRLPVKLVFDDPGICAALHLVPGMSVAPQITVR